MLAIEYAGRLTPTMRSRALEVYDEIYRAKGVTLTHIWGLGASGDHLAGKALDFMVFENVAAGHFIANYVMANHKRLGVRYIMWNHRIWNVDRDQYGAWRWVEDRGSGTKNHMDHVHVSYYNKDAPYVEPGPVEKPDLPDPKPDPRPTGPTKVTVDGKMGPATITLLQTRMKAKGYAVTVDGEISEKGSQVVRAVQEFLNTRNMRDRRNRRLVVDGKGLRSNNDGNVGPTSTIQSLQRYLRLPQDGVLSHPTSKTVRALQERLNANTF